MKTRSWLKGVLALLIVLLLILNLYTFFTREWESSFSPTSYATLYYPLDVPTIREWKVVDRNHLQLNLACAQEIAEWKVLTDGSRPQTAKGMTPSFRIDTTFSKLFTYTLVPVPEGACQAIEISVRFYSTEFYGNLGMKHDDVYIVRSNVPCGAFEQYSIADWTDDYAYVGKEGLAEADRIIREEVKIRDGDPTMVKMEKLFPYLRKKLKGIGGVPKDDERWMNPWVLYNELINKTAKGWCTQHAQMWVFWANRAGIPTRFVFGARTQDNTITYTGHSWGESYIAEQGRWAFVDLSHGPIYITSKKGTVLNSAELFHLNQQDAFDSTIARMYIDWEWVNRLGVSKEDTVISAPFTQCNAVVSGEFTPHSIFKYRRPPNVEDVRENYTGFWKDRTFLLANLERYLFKPQLAYSLYPTEGGHTYFVRRSLFALLLVCAVGWFVLYIRRR
jgi:hypothetical protein